MNAFLSWLFLAVGCAGLLAGYVDNSMLLGTVGYVFALAGALGLADEFGCNRHELY